MFGIYIHIPFCLRKCDYCDFFSIPISRDEAPHEEYLKSLCAQLERDAATLDLSGREVGSIYFGGGTPSLMPPGFFSKLIEALASHFSMRADLEVSCEINPATADARWFRDARSAGITRCSIGVQSFQDRLLRALGRIHTADDAMRAIADAQDAGFEGVSVDLMYAIPGETMGELEEEVRTAMTFQPNHVSAYQLTIEEGTPMAQRGVSVDDDDALNQMRTVARMLSRGGWHRYEISNFAKPDFECRHNLNYWRYGEYLGLGAGATSFLYHRTIVPSYYCTSFARRFTQARDVNAYMKEGAAFAESEEVDVRTAMAEFCFLGLRTTEGISASSFKQELGVEFHSIFGAVIERLLKARLVITSSNRVALTQKGTEISNQVFERFLA